LQELHDALLARLGRYVVSHPVPVLVKLLQAFQKQEGLLFCPLLLGLGNCRVLGIRDLGEVGGRCAGGEIALDKTPWAEITLQPTDTLGLAGLL
jgi:hypothetical protein